MLYQGKQTNKQKAKNNGDFKSQTELGSWCHFGASFMNVSKLFDFPIPLFLISKISIIITPTLLCGHTD